MDFSSLWQNRKRAAPVVLLVGALFVGKTLADRAPSRVPVSLELESPRDVTRVSVRALESEAVAFAIDWSFRGDAPARLERSLSLAPGDYVLAVDVVRGERGESFERRVRVPVEGTIALREDPR